MYKYEYETISCDMSGFGLFNGKIYLIDDYKSVIEERAKKDGDI